MIARIVIWIGFVMISIVTQAQHSSITKDQMYEDFDFLEQTIVSVNPTLVLKSKLFNRAISDSIHELRKQIETCSSTLDFQLIVKQVLNSCIDGHSVLITNYPYPDIQLMIPLTYSNGEYYVKRGFSYDSLEFIAGMELRAINGNADVHSEINQLVSKRYLMRWDVERKRFYSELFYLSDNYIQQGNIELTFVNQRDTLIQRFEFSKKVKLKPFEVDDPKRIFYFKDEDLLYIRVPSMDWSDRKYYKKEIPKIVSNNKPAAIVIDVRYNMGGSSIVGRNIFRSILSEPFQLETKIYANPSFVPSNKYKRVHGFQDGNELESIVNLDSIELRNCIKTTESIRPFRNSIKHAGPIFILGNEFVYSAGAAIFSFANQSNTDEIYSIGSRTGWFLGEFTDPIDYKLPNSQLEYKIAPTFSLSGVNGWEDVMLDKYDYYIESSVLNYQKFYSQSESLYTNDFLHTNDPYFDLVLRLIKRK